MGLSFANPMALWALLGLPAILLLHFLQSKNRVAVVSTLFLLEHLLQDTRKGAILTKLKTGWQLWLQLLAVLLLTLLLAQPRILKEESVQYIALVVDSSSSMQAFQPELLEAVEEIADRLDGISASVRWWVLPSDEALSRQASGTELSELPGSIVSMPFPSGPHDLSPRLREARRLVGPEGVVMFVTDHADREVSSEVMVVGVGRPLPNVSLSGLHFPLSPQGERRWQVSVVNRSNATETRTLHVINEDGSDIFRSEVTVSPGGFKTMEGNLPESVLQGTVRLEPEDDFPRDDVIPFVRPKPKPFGVRIRVDSEPLQQWMERIVAAVAGASIEEDGDVVFRSFSQAGSTSAGEILVRFAEDTHPFGRILPARHPLVETLDWDSLLAQPLKGLSVSASDDVLLRLGGVPLVLLRKHEAGTSLLLNFDPEAGNGIRHAGVALLIYRYLTSVQRGLEVEEWVNGITGQPMVLPDAEYRFRPLSGEAVVDFDPKGRLPKEAGWLEGTRDGEVMIKAAVATGELEEGDLRKASSQVLSDDLLLKARSRHRESDWLLPLWMTLLGMTILGTWWAGDLKFFTANRH